MVSFRNIHLLDTETINQIAAGEVIESAVSVVKELVENALDAGASEIEVETLGGGQGLIVVKDNGMGICEHDIPLALQKHATSKIQKFSDLFSLNSFGFRGEALSAIASISKIEIITAVEGAEAIKVKVLGGQIVSSEFCVRQRGTTMRITDLFYNVPVRKSFQRSSQSNRMAIKKLLENQILTTQGIKWTWLNERRHELSCSQHQTFAEKVSAIMGETFTKDAFLLNCKDDSGMALLGYFGAPYEHRSTRQGQRIFINHRPIDSLFISNKILEAYSFLLPPQRYPLFIANIQLPPHWCDFNVHPRKTEVRLLKTDKIGPWLFKKVSEALLSANFDSVDGLSVASEALHLPSVFDATHSKETQKYCLQSSLDMHEHVFHHVDKDAGMMQESTNLSEIPTVIEQPKRLFDENKDHKQRQLHMCWEEQYAVRFLTAVDGVLLVEDDEGVHAVFSNNARKHLFFSMLTMRQEDSLSQSFLVPVQVNVTSQEKDFIVNHLESLKDMGLDLVQISPCTFALHSAPSCIHEDELSMWFLSFVAEGIRNGEEVSLKTLITPSLKKIGFSKTKKPFDPAWLMFFWKCGKPEKGFDGSIIRKKLVEADFLALLKINKESGC